MAAHRLRKFASFAGVGGGRASALAERLRSSLPALLLALALGWTLLLNADRAHYYEPMDWDTAKNLAIAENLSPQHNFRMFISESFTHHGEPYYDLYGRFPIGGFALIKLATFPFGENALAKIFAARMLMLAFLAGAAFLSYIAINRIASNKWIALTATLIAFSSYYILRYSNSVSNEFMMDLFGVMLTFHGVVVFLQEGRFRQLAVKTCVALLIGWHVYALIAPVILLGLGNEMMQGIKAGYASPTRAAGATALVILRSPYSRLGVVALLLGVMLLAFNLLNEYSALNGEVPPTYRVMIDRLIAGETLTPEEGFDWGAFWGQQFHRIAKAAVPDALTRWLGPLGEGSSGARSILSAVLGLAAIGAGLVGALFVRRERIALAALASFGLCWAFLARFSVIYPSHQHEAIFYLGVPMTLATLLLLSANRSPIARFFPAAAAVALAVFALSAWQAPAKDADEELFERRESIISDLANVRASAQGKNVVVANPSSYQPGVYGGHAELHFLLSGSRLRNLADGLPAEYDFALIPHRRDESAPSVTPDNEIFFLYEKIAPPEVSGLFLDSIVSLGEPAARAVYDIHRVERALVYVKEPCVPSDYASAFFLHVFPKRPGDLPEWRKQSGFDNLDFHFPLWGVSDRGACVSRVPLPEYEIGGIRTGQHRDGEEIWETAFSFDSEAHRAAYAAAASREPVARAEFDLYFDENERTLIYVKEPCSSQDVERRFFLHVVPERQGDLPKERQETGFEARDFDFRLRGAVFDGKCAASVPLPEYAVARVRTGQWVSGQGATWGVAVDFPR